MSIQRYNITGDKWVVALNPKGRQIDFADVADILSVLEDEATQPCKVTGDRKAADGTKRWCHHGGRKPPGYCGPCMARHLRKAFGLDGDTGKAKEPPQCPE